LKLKISADEQIVAASSVDTLLIQSFVQSSENIGLQILPIVIATFAMGPRGANLAYFNRTTQVQIAGTCP
jgi:hypothetical protein